MCVYLYPDRYLCVYICVCVYRVYIYYTCVRENERVREREHVAGYVHAGSARISTPNNLGTLIVGVYVIHGVLRRHAIS